MMEETSTKQMLLHNKKVTILATTKTKIILACGMKEIKPMFANTTKTMIEIIEILLERATNPEDGAPTTVEVDTEETIGVAIIVAEDVEEEIQDTKKEILQDMSIVMIQEAKIVEEEKAIIETAIVRAEIKGL